MTDSPRWAPDTPPPAQLPREVGGFVGRHAELAELDALGDTGAVVVCGDDGVGKTALALHWARGVTQRFEAGQLFVDLRGDSPHPRPPARVLDRMLRALGIAPDEIPAQLADRTALFRSLASQRHLLVVLDNAADSDQVRPLLPPKETGLTVVTSRSDLDDLMPDAQRLELGPLSPADSRRLLAAKSRTADGISDEVIEACGGRPLALRLAAGYVINRRREHELLKHLRRAAPAASRTPDIRPRRAAAERAVPAEQASGVRGDPGGPIAVRRAKPRPHRPRTADVATVEEGAVAAREPAGTPAVDVLFALTHHHLPRRARRLLWLIGIHPSRDPDSPSLAAMADLPLDKTIETLNQLAETRLVDPSRSGGWVVHDLIRARAAELDPTEDPDAAFTRLLNWYLVATARATEAAFGTRPDIDEAGTPAAVPSFSGADGALEWLDDRQDCLYQAVLCAREHGAQRPAAYLAAAMFRYFSVRSHIDEWIDISTVALDAARMDGDRRVEGRLWLNLGYAYLDSSHNAEAEDCFQNSLSISQELRDKRGQATVLQVLAGSNMVAGRFRQSYEYSSVALPMNREMGDAVGEAIALEHLGIVDTLRGEYSQAIWLMERSLAILREHDVRGIVPDAHCELALPHMRQSEYDVAERHLTDAVEGFTALGDDSAIGWARSRLGLVKSLRGEHAEAMADQRRATREMSRSPKHSYRAEALNNAGTTYRLAGRPAKALDHHRLAAESAERAECPYEGARAVQGMGLVHRDSGSHHLADKYLSDARTRFMMLGAAEAHPR